MADVKTSKRTLKQIFEEAMSFDKKLVFKGPDNIRPDSRHAIVEIASDHVVFKLLGEEQHIVPFAALTFLKSDPKNLTVGYR